MNKSYKTVWNETTGTYVAAPEVAKGGGKKSRSRKTLAAVFLTAGAGFSAAAQAGALDGGVVPPFSYDIAYGPGATVLGTNNAALGSIAIGANASADNTGGFGTGSTAIGSSAASLGGGLAVGGGASANTRAVALGNNANASANAATSVGYYSAASGAGSVALGEFSAATNSNSIAIGINAAATVANSVALGSGSTTAAAVATTGATIGGTAYTFAGTAPLGTVSVGALGSERTITNVAAGSLSATSTDAVNGSELFATNQQVTQNSSDITNLTNNINNGSVGLVQQDATTRNITVAKDTDGTVVDFTGTAGARQLTGVAAGAVNATSVDAVNGSQLYATNQNVAQNTTDIAGNTTAITNLSGDVNNITNQINNGEIGLVQQDAATRNITVAKDTDGTVVDFTGTAGARQLTGVAAGAVNATSVDAVNGSQLYGVSQSVANAIGGGSTVNTDGSISAPSYVVDNTTVNNVGDAITNLDGRTTQNSSDITNLNTQITNVNGQLADAVMYDSSAHDKVTLGGAGSSAPVQLTNVAAGELSATSTDAVNGSQLYATNQNVAQNTTDIAGNTTAINNITNQINNGEVGLVQQDATTRNITVAKDTDGTVVDFTGTAGSRQLTGVAAGAVNATSVDAVNGSQLYGVSQSVANAIGGGSTVNTDGSISAPSYVVDNTTVNNVGDAITNLDGRTTQNTSDITNLNTQITNVNGQLADAVMYDSSAHDKVTLGGAGSSAPVQLTNVAAGELSATSTDAVNGSQLYATNQNVSQNTTDIAGNTTAITNLSGDVNNITNQINNGEIGLVQQDATTHNITVAKDTDGTVVDFTGTAGARQLTGVAAGALNATSVDAVNGSQLYATNQNVAQNTTDITNLTNTINNGGVGLVQQDAATRNITVAKDTDGTVVDFTGTAGTRNLTGVTAGNLSATSVDAVNGSQLYATNQNVAQNTTNIAGNTTAITNLSGDVNNITNQINNGEVGLVQQDATTRNITVAKDTDGTVVDFTGTAGAPPTDGCGCRCGDCNERGCGERFATVSA